MATKVSVDSSGLSKIFKDMLSHSKFFLESDEKPLVFKHAVISTASQPTEYLVYLQVPKNDTINSITDLAKYLGIARDSIRDVTGMTDLDFYLSGEIEKAFLKQFSIRIAFFSNGKGKQLGIFLFENNESDKEHGEIDAKILTFPFTVAELKSAM